MSKCGTYTGCFLEWLAVHPEALIVAIVVATLGLSYCLFKITGGR